MNPLFLNGQAKVVLKSYIYAYLDVNRQSLSCIYSQTGKSRSWGNEVKSAPYRGAMGLSAEATSHLIGIEISKSID